jgi:hypothetical protein
LSPFYRTTQNQIQLFYLDQLTNFVSGLNVGKQTSRGIEFELDKGNFNANGLSARLSFTYTNSFIKYQNPPGGLSVITPLNNAIVAYNDLTKYCATHPSAASCGSPAEAAKAAPCYTPYVPASGSTPASGGTADPTCATGSIANPYWNAPAQGLLNPDGNYPTFNVLPAGIGSSVNGYGAPYVGSLVLNERSNKFSIAPIVQFFAGQRYGATWAGTTVANDPRYKYGAPGGSPFDAYSCASNLAIPDPYTSAFDGIGAFVAPTQLEMHLQLSYDVSKTFSLVANVTNIVNACFGGTKVGFVSGSVNGNSVCSYNVVGAGTGGDIGNLYNPGAPLQAYANTPYEPSFAPNPLGFYVNAKLKI